MSTLTGSPAWQALEQHRRELEGTHLRELFAADPERFERFSLRLDDLLLDYSKNRITGETLRLLLDLARQARRRGLARSHVRGREDQRDRGPGGAARGAAQPLQSADPGRRRGRDAGR